MNHGTQFDDYLVETKFNIDLLSKENLKINSDDTQNNYSENKTLIEIETKKFDCIDDIIDRGGYNLITFKIFALTSILVIADGFYVNYFSVILIPFQSFYKISDFAIEFISGLNFLGLAFGSFISGPLTKKFTRLNLIYICIIELRY